MTYPDYLRTQAGECVALAVRDPWDRETAALIDLAQDYQSMAADFDRAGPEPQRAEQPESDAWLPKLFRHW